MCRNPLTSSVNVNLLFIFEFESLISFIYVFILIIWSRSCFWRSFTAWLNRYVLRLLWQLNLFHSLTLRHMEGITSTRGPRGLQKPTWHSRPTKDATADKAELLFHGTATKHMEARPNSQVGHTCFTHLFKMLKYWLDIYCGPGSEFLSSLSVFMMDQPRDGVGRGGSSSGEGMGQSMLAACSATMCCCCLWNVLRQYLWGPTEQDQVQFTIWTQEKITGWRVV